MLQVSLLLGDRQLADSQSVGDATQAAATAIPTAVVVAPASVYQGHLEEARRSKGFFRLRGVAFPEPKGVSINMMPFVMGDPTSLPGDLRQYSGLIDACLSDTESERGKIGFLTIQEGEVAAGMSQRRPGLHLETPGIAMQCGRVIHVEVHWGGGDDYRQGGIFTASTVAESCRVWDVRIAAPDEVVGPLGEVEHSRELLGEGTFMDASTLYWMSDRTPHESMPLERAMQRQYFRLVTSSVSVWYERHSTPNPLGIVPDASVTQTLTHDKFLDLGRIYAPNRQSKVVDESWDILEGEQDELEERLKEAGLRPSFDSCRGHLLHW